MVRRLYLNNLQFATVSDLRKDIQEVWNSIDMQVIQNLMDSVKNRIFQVIGRHGDVTDY